LSVPEHTLQDPISIGLGNGIIPNHLGKGIVELNDGRLVACKHVSFTTNGMELAIMPTSKQAVDNRTGHIRNEGAVFLYAADEKELGRSWMANMAIDVTRHPWHAERLRRGHAVWDLGEIVMRDLCDPTSFVLPEFQAIDTEADIGLEFFIPRPRYF
jgi:hypothetical protein